MNSFNSINSSSSHLTTPLSPEDSSAIVRQLKLIAVNRFFRPETTTLNKLETIDPEELTKILHRLFSELLHLNSMKDPVQCLERLAAVLPLEKIQGAVHVEDALEEAKNMFEEAKLFLQMSQGNSSPTIRARISTLLDGILAALESIIMAFGMGDFFQPAESGMHADFKSQKIIMLLSLFGMITTMILPLLGIATGGIIVGAIFLTIIALSILWPYIKPRPSHLPGNAQNWTQQVQHGGFVAQGRKQSLDEIADIFKRHRHAMLVGPSRVGKSLTAKAFAQAIEQGDYPELKGKVVFRINAADIVDQKPSFLGGGSNILKEISAAMGRHRDEVILVIDEAHMLCKSKKSIIADQLKLFLDKGGAFPRVIGITTKAEYEEHVEKNVAFALRFEKVDIENTSEDETIKILSDTILSHPSKPLMANNVLGDIYERSGKDEAPQPTSALQLLERCITRTERKQKSRMAKEMLEISAAIESLRSQAIAYRGVRHYTAKIASLEKKRAELQKKEDEGKDDLDTLFRSKDLLDRVIKETYTSLIKMSTLLETPGKSSVEEAEPDTMMGKEQSKAKITQKTMTTKNEKQLKLFLLLHKSLAPFLYSHIEKKSPWLDVQLIIDEQVVISA